MGATPRAGVADRVPIRVALGATAATVALSIVARLITGWADWEFPSWGETAVEVAWMLGVCGIVAVGFRRSSGHTPEPGELGCQAPTAHLLGRRGRFVLGAACLVLAGVVLASLDTNVLLIAATFLVRWPLSVIAQQTLFFGWLQPRLGDKGSRTAALLYAGSHIAAPALMIGVLPLGFLFASLRARTGSIRAGLAAHYIGNLVFVLAFT
jgi:hypothetical protein